MLRDSRHLRNFGRVTFKTARYMYRREEHGRIRCAPVLMQSVFSHAAAMALRTYNRLDKRLEHHMSRDGSIDNVEPKRSYAGQFYCCGCSPTRPLEDPIAILRYCIVLYLS